MGFLRGLFVQRDGSNNGTSPKGARLALGGLLGRSSTGTVQPGVLSDGPDPVVTGTGAMSYSVRACAIVTKSSDANGPTVSVNDAPAVITTTAAPGSNSRIDTVYAIQNLITADGGSGTSNEFLVAVVQGSVSATPSAPSIPPGAVRLADVTVTAGATATSGLSFAEPADLWTTANGGIVPTSKGSRLGRAWDGTRRALVPLGLIVAGASDANRAVSFMQVGYTEGTANISGDLTINLPQAFPTALTGVIVTEAISIGGGAGLPYVAKFLKDFSGPSSFVVRTYQADTGALAGGGAIRVSWLAFGY